MAWLILQYLKLFYMDTNEISDNKPSDWCSSNFNKHVAFESIFAGHLHHRYLIMHGQLFFSLTVYVFVAIKLALTAIYAQIFNFKQNI